MYGGLSAEELFGDQKPTDAEISAGFHRWKAQLKAGALQDLDGLIERDKGTPREKMWRDIRADYEQFLAEEDSQNE